MAYNSHVDPIDHTRWCPRDTAIKKTWRYCNDCEARRKAGRCPYMWLYWQTKGRSESEERPPLETYHRGCASCGNKLTLHHALIHLLNASGYREVGVEYEHTKHIAKFQSCPFCFSGIGWHPGKPPPDEEITPETAMKLERIERLRVKLDAPEDNPAERRSRITGALRKKSSVDTSFAEYIEFEGSDTREAQKSEPAAEAKPKIQPVYPEKPEWIFGREEDEESVPAPSAMLADELDVDFNDLATPYTEAESSLEAAAGETVELTFEGLPDPHYEGVARCPNHEHKNADRICPLCYREVCVECMAFVDGVTGCRECFGDYKIRRMFDIPPDWESRPRIELEPQVLPERYAGFGFVKIDSEGAPASSRHRFFAHALDGALSAFILGLLQFLYTFPLNETFERMSRIIAAMLDKESVVDFYLYSPAEALGRTLGFGWLYDLGVTSGWAWWIVCWPALTWLFAGVIPAAFLRSPGQHLCNLAVVDSSGRWISGLSAVYRVLLAIPGVLSFGALAALNYALGPTAGSSLTDSWMHTRVVTYSGRRWAPPRDMRVVRVAVLGERRRRSEEVEES